MRNTITFETKCWEKDWDSILQTGYLNKQISNCNYDFDRKLLFINNVNNLNEVKKYALLAKNEGCIDQFYVVQDYAEEALKYFGLKVDDFKGGFYYSIEELVAIYLCKTKYLVHFSGDSITQLGRDKSYSWINNAINLLEERSDIAVVNPLWNYEKYDALNAEVENFNNYSIGYGFSDQCYLVRVDEFRKDIYKFKHIDSERYPKYGGELFEKRVDSYMRCNNRLRATDMRSVYTSVNIDSKERFYKSQRIISILQRMYGRKYHDNIHHCKKIIKKFLKK